MKQRERISYPSPKHPPPTTGVSAENPRLKARASDGTFDLLKELTSGCDCMALGHGLQSAESDRAHHCSAGSPRSSRQLWMEPRCCHLCPAALLRLSLAEPIEGSRALFQAKLSESLGAWLLAEIGREGQAKLHVEAADGGLREHSESVERLVKKALSSGARPASSQWSSWSLLHISLWRDSRLEISTRLQIHFPCAARKHNDASAGNMNQHGPSPTHRLRNAHSGPHSNSLYLYLASP